MVTDLPLDAEDLLLEHLDRYGLTTPQAVQAALLPGAGLEGVQALLHRLTESRIVSALVYDAQDSIVFYHLPGQEPTCPAVLEERYAVLALCCLHGPNRNRVTPRELRDSFPDFADHNGIDPERQSYVLDHTRHRPRLSRVLFDNHARTENLVRKCQRCLARACGIPGLDEMLKHRLFFLSLLTAQASKADIVRRACRKAGLGDKVEVFALPQLDLFF